MNAITADLDARSELSPLRLIAMIAGLVADLAPPLSTM